MFPRFVWNFLNPRRWFRARNTTIALPAPPLPPSPSIGIHTRMEEQESPEPEQVAPSRDNSTASSYKSAKGEISPSQSETNTPRRSLDSDAEEVQNDEENELKLHELSDQDSSSDDDEEMELHRNKQVTTPPNLHGPSNFRRTSLVMKKRKLTDSSDEECKSQKRIKKATKARPSPSSESTTSNESVVIVDEVIREPTRKNRRTSMLIREKVENESDTPISTRKRLSIKTERFDPSPAEVTRAKSRKENDTPSTSKVSSGRKEKEKEVPSTSAAKNNVAILLKQKTFATPSSSKSVKKSRMERGDTPSSVASMSRLNVRASTPMMNRPQRACRAMTVSPTRFLRDPVTPSRSSSKVITEKRGRGRPPTKKSPLAIAEI